MELLFIDESGDNGLAPGSTEHFILAGISMQASHWKEFFWKVVAVKEDISRRYGIRITEFKGSDLFTHRGAFFDTRLQPIENRAIYERLVDLLCEPQLNLFVTVHSKAEFRRDQSSLSEKHLIRAFSERVWRQYLYDYERYLLEKTRLIGHPQNALLYFDSNPSQEKYIRRLTRDFARRFDQQGSFPNAGIVEDIIFRDSKTSYLIQLADILAFSNRIIWQNKRSISKPRFPAFTTRFGLSQRWKHGVAGPENGGTNSALIMKLSPAMRLSMNSHEATVRIRNKRWH